MFYCILDNHKLILRQTSKTQMKCLTMRHLSESALFVRLKNNSQGLRYILENSTYDPLICTVNHAELSVPNQMEEFMSLQRVKEIFSNT